MACGGSWRGAIAVLMFGLALSSGARAQSAASFPEPAPAPQPAPAPPPPNPYTPPPPVTAPAPVPVAPTPPAPAPAAPAPAPIYTPPPVYGPTPQLTLANLPPILPYRKGLPVPPGYRVVERSATGLKIGGGLTFLGAYAAALGLAATQSFENGTGYAAIPLAGPWAAIGGRTFKCQAPVTTNTVQALQRAINKCVGTAFDEVVTVIFLTADGLIQATGATLFFIGLGSSYLELVREDLPKTAVHVLPEGGFGLTVRGEF